MERGLVMVVHAFIIVLLVYIIMVYAMKQDSVYAENKSILVGTHALTYMLTFGHKLPSFVSNLIK